jgi:hypothetical protein
VPPPHPSVDDPDDLRFLLILFAKARKILTWAFILRSRAAIGAVHACPQACVLLRGRRLESGHIVCYGHSPQSRCPRGRFCREDGNLSPRGFTPESAGSS